LLTRPTSQALEHALRWFVGVLSVICLPFALLIFSIALGDSGGANFLSRLVTLVIWVAALAMAHWVFYCCIRPAEAKQLAGSSSQLLYYGTLYLIAGIYVATLIWLGVDGLFRILKISLSFILMLVGISPQ
jgi:hypothetical protein